jgi:hypothetical protein
MTFELEEQQKEEALRESKKYIENIISKRRGQQMEIGGAKQ